MRFPRKVYVLTHVATGKKYVGSSYRPELRYKNHLCLLKYGKHPVKNLQFDYDHFGKEFDFQCVDDIDDIYQKKVEYAWQEKLHTKNPQYGYNYNDRGLS